MLTRLSKNVVCIKDIPSNLIEEAFFILKESSGETEGKYTSKRKEIVMSEINEMINDYAQKIQNEKNEQRKKEIEARDKLRKVKLKTLVIAAAFIVSCLIIAAIKL
ncbi:MAG: hypothetical protein IJ217_05955 [Clostridia bacterium]|nr:hypothetical protein [Clostridia bacterium]